MAVLKQSARTTQMVLSLCDAQGLPDQPQAAQIR
jgi:hypothetical protein